MCPTGRLVLEESIFVDVDVEAVSLLWSHLAVIHQHFWAAAVTLWKNDHSK